MAIKLNSYQRAGVYEDPEWEKKAIFRRKLEAFLQAEKYNLSVTKDSGTLYYLDEFNNMIVLDNHKYYYFNSYLGKILHEGEYTDNVEEFVRDYKLNNLLDGK
jgi:hypothetical protein